MSFHYLLDYLIFMTEQYPIVWIYYSLFMHSPEGHLDRFQCGVIMEKAVIHIACRLMCAHTFLNQLGKYLGTHSLHCLIRLYLAL